MHDTLLSPTPDQVLAVTDLTRMIKRRLEEEFTRFWVRGEVSNLRRQSSGHVYFSLKDRGSQLPCVLFARDAAQQSFELEDGMELLLLGDLSVYEPHGRYQLIAKVAIQSGEGRLQLAYEKLKRKLAAEGLFDSSRKLPLPLLPKRIAVITSPTGAALRDFLRILRRRQYSGEVVIFPARVQGQEAPAELKNMLTHASMSEGFDLIVMTRGGGSIEDLWAFNDEALARAVVECEIPVISAVGHEIDHVLTDFAADCRAETPSGAAELISSAYLETIERVRGAGDQLRWLGQQELSQRQQRLDGFHARLKIIAPERQLQLLQMRLDEAETRFRKAAGNELTSRKQSIQDLRHSLERHHPHARIQLLEERLKNYAGRIQLATRGSIRNRQQQLDLHGKRLKNNDIQATLKRGYSILRDESGAVLDNAETVKRSNLVTAQMHDGDIQLANVSKGRL